MLKTWARGLCLLFLLFSLSSPAARAGDSLPFQKGVQGPEPWEITAKTLSYNEAEGLYTAEGDVVISKAGQALYTQKATYNIKTAMAEAEGGFRLESGGDFATGESGTFNLQTQTGIIRNGTLFLKQNHYYLSGGIMEKTGKDSYIVRDCRLTTCDGPHPDWTITGKEVKVTLEGYGQVSHATFRARDVPLLYFPYMLFPAKTQRQTGLLPPRMGYSTFTGGDLEIPFYWAIGEQADLTFYQRGMSRRGYMQGVELDYVTDPQSKGIALFDILNDKIATKDMTDGDALQVSPFPRTNRTRYWLRGKLDQALPLGLTVRGDADYVSDQDYLIEFEKGLFGLDARPDLARNFDRPIEERRSPTRRSALRLERDGENYSLQAGGSFHELPQSPGDNAIPQPLGAVTYTLMPEQVAGWPLFFDLGTDYGYVWRKEGIKGNRVVLSPRVSAPLWLGPYVECEPSLRYTYNGRWYNNLQGEDEGNGDQDYEARARIQTSAERFFDVGWGGASRLRHKISPVLTYRYKGFKGTEDTPWFEPTQEEHLLDHARNLVLFSLENYLDARYEDAKGQRSYRQWASFFLQQGYAIGESWTFTDPGMEEKNFTPMTATLIVTPFSSLDLRGSASWDHYARTFSGANVSLQYSRQGKDIRPDIYKIDYGYEQEGIKNLNLWANVHVGWGLSLGGNLQRDISQGANIVSAGWVGYDSQCWGFRVGAERENADTSVLFLVNLLGLATSPLP